MNVPSSQPQLVLSLPGIGGSGPEHWQTIWERTLPATQRIEQKDWDRPVCSDWCDAIEHAVQQCDKPPLFVAHSLGCLAFVHWCSRSRLTVAGALLVAAPDPTASSFPSTAVGFTPLPPRALPFPSTLVASTDDPYATLSFAESWAAVWRSHLVNVGNSGHINADSGLGSWEAGLALLSELEGRSCVILTP